MATSKENIISNIYYDVEDGYGSIKKNTLSQANKVDSTITTEDVQSFMKQQPNKQRKPYKGTNSYTAPFPRYEYQIDIMDMLGLQKSPEQPRYCFVCIDMFSKLGAAIAMESKDAVHVHRALLKMFKTIGHPMSIYSDQDQAFKGIVNTLFDGEGITHVTTKTHANVVERWIRT